MPNKRCLLITIATSLILTVGGLGAVADDYPEQTLLSVKVYLISGSAGQSGLSFPIFPHMSMAVVEETISDIELFYERLRALYAFSEYQLLEVSTWRVRLDGYPQAKVGQVTRPRTHGTGRWVVELADFAWDREGRLQTMVTVEREGKPFLESHVSVLPGRSVVLGRFSEGKMKEAVFAVVAPLIEVTTMAGQSKRMIDNKQNEGRGLALQKTGLPPPGPHEKDEFSDEETDGLPAEDDFVPLSVMPALVREVPVEYPESATRAGAEGKVWIRSLISTEGKVLKCNILRSSGREDLDQAALTAARQYQFQAARDKNDQLITTWVAFQIVFALKDK